MRLSLSFTLLCFLFALNACRTTSRPGIFAKRTPHEMYAGKITDAGLHTSALGSAWLAAAKTAVTNPVKVNKPHRETGFFSADRPTANGLGFNGVRGERLEVSLTRVPATGFNLYLDLWQIDTSGRSEPRLIASADTHSISIRHDVEETGIYVVRIQPELLQDCEYTVEISSGASLAYPIRAPGKNHIKSFWGADRDGGSRRHEGIDIFAARRTPVVAVADGRVTRVNENRLGGKVVWLRPAGRNYTLYYAHLDTQLVSDGEEVKTGDTLGLMGNTGNARTTAPHLHFGIYTFGGAIDPLPFVKPDYPEPPALRADAEVIGKQLRASGRGLRIFESPVTKSRFSTLEQHTLVRIEAATADFYRVSLPDGRLGYISAEKTIPLKPIRTLTLKDSVRLLSTADSVSPGKRLLQAGSRVQELAGFGNFKYVEAEKDRGWINGGLFD